ncbi:hypothetical protein SISNIDRAFT_449676 [Sistotremastrum niveocremeum HHB9708]|uniref:FMP27 GFWDK domain-containing protein n=1 Tax=Sistotremastrum niveocremeum HHB9708 TaxID=1314777 RepID=A0A164ZTG6_9AGAM|nr:hypothetical protein SISNIDRAFT_449676 [Sistotremastrum niveocremeum HHB9708]
MLQATRSFIASVANCTCFGCSSGPYSAWLLSQLLQLSIALLIFSRYIAPFFLRQVTSRVRVRSISLRSIKGLYICTGNVTLSIERIGLAYHQKSAEHARRFSFQIIGLRLELDPKGSKETRKHADKEKSDAAPPSPPRRALQSLTGAFASVLNWGFRPAARWLFVTFLRLLIRGLPALTQVFDVELDRAVVCLVPFGGAHLSASGVSLSSRVEFTEHDEAAKSRTAHKKLIKPVRHTPSPESWRTRFKGSFTRAWDRAWGKTEGFVSISVAVKDIAAYQGMPEPISTPRRTPGSRNASHFQKSVSLSALQNSNLLFKVSKPARFHVSTRFSPKIAELHEHTLSASVELSDVHVIIHTCHDLLQQFKNSAAAVQQVSPTLSPSLAESPADASPATPPSSPFMDTLNNVMNKGRFRKSTKSPAAKAQNRMIRLLLKALEKFEIRIKHASAEHSWTHSGEPRPTLSHKWSTDSVLFGFGISKASENDVHLRLLGKQTIKNGTTGKPTPPLMLFFGLHESNIYQSLGDPASSSYRPLLRLGSVDVQILSAQWPPQWVSDMYDFADDPNGSLVAIQLQVEDIVIREDLDTVKAIMSSRVVKTPQVPKAVKSWPTIWYPAPRLHWTVLVDKVSVQIFHESRGRILLDMRSEGLDSAGALDFKDVWLRPRRVLDQPSTRMSSLYAMLEGHVHINPFFIRIVPPSRMLSFSESPSEVAEAALLDVEPTLALAEVEIAVSGAAPALVMDEWPSATSIELSSGMIDVQCSTDDLAVELWNQEVIAELASLVALWTTKAQELSQPRKAEILPYGISIQISLVNATACLAKRDLNPSCDMQLSRGLHTTLGSTFAYCSVSWKHRQACAQLGLHDARAHQRQRLNVPEDLPQQTLALTNISAEPESQVTLIQVAFHDVAIRNVVATPFAASVTYLDELRSREPISRQSLPIAIPSVMLRASRMPLSREEKDRGEPLGEFRVTLELSQVFGELDMLTIYSGLLAAKVVTTVRPGRDSRTANELESTKAPSSAVQIRIARLEILFNFPVARSKLFIRMHSFASSLHNHKIGLDLKNTLLYVPSHIHSDKWEELGRLKDCHLDLALNSHKSSTSKVTIDALRVSLPWKFILADLILSINLTVKSFRHLKKVVADGEFRNMAQPEVEPAKRVPDLTIVANHLVFEARDNPFESRLGLISVTGKECARVRLEREEAFEAKVAAIRAAESANESSVSQDHHQHHTTGQFHFTPQHSIPVNEAHERLLTMHSQSWMFRFKEAAEDQVKAESSFHRRLFGTFSSRFELDPIIDIDIASVLEEPPLFRLSLSEVTVGLGGPSFGEAGLTSFIKDLGNGVPEETTFTLLIPLHVSLSATALSLTVRDYPLPLLVVPSDHGEVLPSFSYVSDLVIAEEAGPSDSIDWLECAVVKADDGIHEAKPFTIHVPKTCMPVKTYAAPIISVRTRRPVEFTWGVSYTPAIQMIAKTLDTITHPPKDRSPALGFWDKMRLVFHWRGEASFKGDLHLNLKGSRDPYQISGTGAGFAFCWQGLPVIEIGPKRSDHEVVRVLSDRMLIVIPKLKKFHDGSHHVREHSFHIGGQDSEATSQSSVHATFAGKNQFKKIVAKFNNGISMGLGFALERSCRQECTECTGEPFHRSCRIFTFRPHYTVKLRASPEAGLDSYDGFRSDFIHFSLSLTSPIPERRVTRDAYSSVHLSGLTFAHFWAWWATFDGALSLPVGQGRLFPDSRPPSPKFGKHLATLKYRVSVSRLFVSHIYKQDTSDTWAEGETPCIGVKGMISDFQADMHQREQETQVRGSFSGGTKTVRHKAVNAAKVIMKGLTLKAICAVFSEPDKQTVLASTIPDISHVNPPKKPWDNAAPLLETSEWASMDDWVEPDWSPNSNPQVFYTDVASCPRFTFFRTATKTTTASDTLGRFAQESAGHPISRFDGEDTHSCFMGSEESVHRVQVALANDRLTELRSQIKRVPSTDSTTHDYSKEEISAINSRRTALSRQASLLESYVRHLETSEAANPSDDSQMTELDSYAIPSETLSAEEWQNFINVYQVHSPVICIDNVTRDFMMQYYYASRARRGFEYRMAARAVKFIRDQVHMRVATLDDEPDDFKRSWVPTRGAQAIRNLLGRDERKSEDEPEEDEQDISSLITRKFDPALGWTEGISVRAGHFCLLLKPQVVLRSEKGPDSVLVLAAANVSLRSFTIVDDANSDDPVNGYVMARTHAALNGLQIFAPTPEAADLCVATQAVPLEVLVDYRCESTDFDRLVPQTDAILQYDKFNRLRLRNKISSVVPSLSDENFQVLEHLQHQTDLVAVSIPRLSVSANSRHFGAISHIVTNLLLFSEPAHKRRLEEVRTYVISYDFSDLDAAARVVADYQGRIRHLHEVLAELDHHHHRPESHAHQERLEIKAQVLSLSEELDLIFDAIKLSQDKRDNNQDQKSALRLLASSSEISWQMIEGTSELLAKLTAKGANFSWLNRQDSSTMNKLVLHDLRAFDGAPDAVWPELLSKHMEPLNHPLVKRGIFADADWSVLAPIGGIAIYEHFQLSLHPIRLQIQTKLGSRILEYVWPDRRRRKSISGGIDRSMPGTPITALTPLVPSTPVSTNPSESGSSSPSPLHLAPPKSSAGGSASPRSPRLQTSRSFTNLRSPGESRTELKRSNSHSTLPSSRATSDGVTDSSASASIVEPSVASEMTRSTSNRDAVEMRSRSTQKTFALVKIESIHLLLSIMKEDAFLCRDARIRTRELEYRNKTSSFEQLADQFIPSDSSWKGWVRMALHQPLLPVLPVARELLTKTKWVSSPFRSNSRQNTFFELQPTPLVPGQLIRQETRSRSPHRQWPRLLKRNTGSKNRTSEEGSTVEGGPAQTEEAEPSRKSQSSGRKMKMKKGHSRNDSQG